MTDTTAAASDPAVARVRTTAMTAELVYAEQHTWKDWVKV